MISRRKFMKYFGASTAAAFFAAKVGALQLSSKHFLPIVAGSGKNRPYPTPTPPSPTPTPTPPDPTQKQIRMVHNWYASYQRADPNDPAFPEVEAIINYFKALGFTHYYYNLTLPNSRTFRNSSGSWVYNNGKYTEGDVARHFQAMKALVEEGENGMHLIPVIENLSHSEIFIAMDPDISEFHDEASLRNWLIAAGITPPQPLDFGWDQYTFVGDYTQNDPQYHNKGMDEFFLEYMRIIKANWGNSPLGGAFPEYVHIGHNELGKLWSCCVKADKSKNLKPSKSELVAAHINHRLSAVQNVISPLTQVMLSGDSFVPHCYGEGFGLVGDLETGDGGVLQILRDKYGVADQLIVQPFTYSRRDNIDEHLYELVSKAGQVAYLDRLSYRYMPCSGEPYNLLVGVPGESLTSSQVVERTKQCTFEWVKISQMYPKNLVGYAHKVWQYEPGYITPEGFCYNFAASLLAYLAWTYGEHSLKLARNNSYGPRIFSKVNNVLSSQEQKWDEGVHYSRPPSRSSLLALASQ